MKIIISNQSDFPIYAQIRNQIKEQILNGTIKEESVLPSIRQLAKELGISVITTTRAYRELETEGYIASMQGKGSIVLKRNNQVLTEQLQKQMEEHLDAAISAAEQIGLTEEALIEVLKMLQKNR